MSVVRLAMTAATVAVSISRNPVVRSALANPRTREMALETTKSAAYTAGRLARMIVGPRTR